jgi:hypothetical protein
LLAYDNLSGIRAEVSDMLCRLSTGGGFSIRALYSDDEERIFSYTRPVMLAGVEDVAGRHDLADRTTSLTLDHIPDLKKKAMSKLLAVFTSARPSILGRLLEIASHGLRDLPVTQLDKLPRMADFALWMAACETVEWSAGTFARAYAANKEALAAASFEADIVAGLVLEMLADGNGWEGTAKSLLTQVDNRASDQQKRAKSWPKTPHAMAGRLRRASEILRAQGWTVEFVRTPGGNRTRTIIIAPDNPAQQSSQTPHRPETNLFNGLGRDTGRDDSVPGPQHTVPASSLGNPLALLGLGRWDDRDVEIPALSDNKCAYCGESDPPPQAQAVNGKAVHLHLDCEEYWFREHKVED